MGRAYMCRISVVTSVFNAEDFIAETIQSVIDQSFSDWEYILLDDCSSDRSAQIIQGYADKDPRIRLVKNETNKGQCTNLNNGIKMARGEFIARLDHDDICHPDRFIKQISYMDEHKDVILLGCMTDTIENGKIREDRYEMQLDSHEEIAFFSFFTCALTHSTFFIRKEAIYEKGIWYDEFRYAEDHDFICKALRCGKVYKLRDNLITYRVFPDQTSSHTTKETARNERLQIQHEYIESLDFEEKEKLMDAAEGKLNTYDDIVLVDDLMTRFALFCGIRKDDMEKPKEYAIQSYMYLLGWQKSSMQMFKAYLKSRFRDRRGFFCKETLSLLKRCISGDS